MIRVWNDINVDMCKSINMIGFGERRYDLYEKINRALKDTTAIVQIVALIVLILIVLKLIF